MAYFTKHSHSIVLFPSCGKQGIHVRVFIMKLIPTEFLYLSAHPLHKVRLQSGNLEKVMHSMLALLGKGKVSLNEAWRVLSPKSSIGVKYPGNRESPVTAQNSRYDRFSPAANDWGTMHPIPDKAPPFQAEEEGPPT
jgi:hypothetical protein